MTSRCSITMEVEPILRTVSCLTLIGFGIGCSVSEDEFIYTMHSGIMSTENTRAPYDQWKAAFQTSEQPHVTKGVTSPSKTIAELAKIGDITDIDIGSIEIAGPYTIDDADENVFTPIDQETLFDVTVTAYGGQGRSSNGEVHLSGNCNQGVLIGQFSIPLNTDINAFPTNSDITRPVFVDSTSSELIKTLLIEDDSFLLCVLAQDAPREWTDTSEGRSLVRFATTVSVTYRGNGNPCDSSHAQC
jgi:hypothetical protein